MTQQDRILIYSATIVVLLLVAAGWWIWQRHRTGEVPSRSANDIRDTGEGPGLVEPEPEKGAPRDDGRDSIHQESRRRGPEEEAPEIRALSASERDRFVADWRRVQEEFDEDPEGAVVRAAQLVNDIMLVRGYPIDDFDRRVPELSVEHSHTLRNYRFARIIAGRQSRDAEATEDLRPAMELYGDLVGELLVTRSASGVAAGSGSPASPGSRRRPRPASR